MAMHIAQMQEAQPNPQVFRAAVSPNSKSAIFSFSLLKIGL
jgi:hypothetical protein